MQKEVGMVGQKENANKSSRDDRSLHAFLLLQMQDASFLLSLLLLIFLTVTSSFPQVVVAFVLVSASQSQQTISRDGLDIHICNIAKVNENKISTIINNQDFKLVHSSSLADSLTNPRTFTNTHAHLYHIFKKMQNVIFFFFLFLQAQFNTASNSHFGFCIQLNRSQKNSDVYVLFCSI